MNQAPVEIRIFDNKIEVVQSCTVTTSSGVETTRSTKAVYVSVNTPVTVTDFRPVKFTHRVLSDD